MMVVAWWWTFLVGSIDERLFVGRVVMFWDW
jgi:hypothetical protein